MYAIYAEIWSNEVILTLIILKAVIVGERNIARVYRQ